MISFSLQGCGQGNDLPSLEAMWIMSVFVQRFFFPFCKAAPFPIGLILWSVAAGRSKNGSAKTDKHRRRFLQLPSTPMGRLQPADFFGHWSRRTASKDQEKKWYRKWKGLSDVVDSFGRNIFFCVLDCTALWFAVFNYRKGGFIMGKYYTFALDEHVNRTSVSYPNRYGIRIAADLYTAKDIGWNIKISCVGDRPSLWRR